jgi:hypothetical protein
LRDHQDKATRAGNHVSDDAVTGEQRHDAKDVAGLELADHGTGAGVVGHRDFGVAADHDTDELAFVTGFQNGFVALEGGEPGLDDNFLDFVGWKVLE